MTSDDRLALILRRLDEIERKLNRIKESYGQRRFGAAGQSSKEELASAKARR
jgi:hypothetical protein